MYRIELVPGEVTVFRTVEDSPGVATVAETRSGPPDGVMARVCLRLPAVACAFHRSRRPGPRPVDGPFGAALAVRHNARAAHGYPTRTPSRVAGRGTDRFDS